MSDRDNITLPSEAVEQALEVLEVSVDWCSSRVLRRRIGEAIEVLRTALAAEQPKPTVKESLTHPGYVIGLHWLETAYSRICAGEAEADVLRDIGLVREEAFLTGVAHLKAENEALRRDAEQGRWLREWLDNNGLLIRAIRGESLAGYEHPDIEALRRDAERYRWMATGDTRRRVCNILPLFNAYAYRKEHIDAAIDAAMGDKR